MAFQSVSVPNPVLTPGAVRPLTLKVICSTRWSLDRRHVTEKMKKQVAAAYGVAWVNHSLYEFDHKIPRELGGADVTDNIYPQCCRQGNRTIGPAHQKDVAENRTHAAVCDGRISLHDAQSQMAKDWTVLYRRFVGELPKVVP